MSKLLLILIVVIVNLFTTQLILARTTPEDIVNSKREVYQKRVQNYSSKHQQRLQELSDQIKRLNSQVTAEQEVNIANQGAILDEYVTRTKTENSPAVEKARYWLTYAHEAIAYQAAKIYIYDLTTESSIKKDVLNLISSLQADLNSTKQKTLNSHQIIVKLIKSWELGYFLLSC